MWTKGYVLFLSVRSWSNGRDGLRRGWPSEQSHPRRHLHRGIAEDGECALGWARIQTKGTGTKRGLTRTHLWVFRARIDLGEDAQHAMADESSPTVLGKAARASRIERGHRKKLGGSATLLRSSTHSLPTIFAQQEMTTTATARSTPRWDTDWGLRRRLGLLAWLGKRKRSIEETAGL